MHKINGEWPALIRSLMTEQGMSERRLCEIAKVPRTSLRHFLAGTSPMVSASIIERTLNALGRELRVMPIQRKGQ